MVTIVIIPKLGPHGSGITSAGFDVQVSLEAGDLRMTPAEWDEYRIRLKRELTITFDGKGDPRLVPLASEK